MQGRARVFSSDVRWSRALIALGLGLVLAVGLGAHAASLVLTKSDSDLAVNLSPLNGAAKEERAFARFQSRAPSPQTATAAARQAAELAREALRGDPLAPRALAILALEEEETTKRRDLLRLASRLNRRDLTLQGLVLRDSMAASRPRASLTTLDQILRVHKGRYDEFLPLLVEAVTRSETLPAFRHILAREARWHRNFFDRASREPRALANLAELRRDFATDVPGLDSRVVEGLARQGDFEAARRLYQFLSHEAQARDGQAADAPWASRLPPFDWTLAKERAMRAQPDRDGSNLEIFVRGGEGGRLAARLVRVPSAPFEVSFAMDGPKRSGTDAARLVVRCPLATTPLVDQPILNGRNSARIASHPPDCEEVLIEVFARVLRGHPTLRARLTPITLTAQSGLP